jgi:4-hydroxybenzoate polyprenyltransferase
MPLVVGWIWVHLLLFNVCNQFIGCAEDALSKPWRPFPSGRVTAEQGEHLSLVLYMFSILFSMSLGTTMTNLVFCGGCLWYNTLGGSSHWFIKNFLNAVGYACFEMGGSAIAGKG